MENKRIEHDYIIYVINDEENTASVIGINGKIGNVYLPRSINQSSKEYEITNISEKALKNREIGSIQFSADSKLQTIDKLAFATSVIKSIKIPSSVTYIGENAFSGCFNLEIVEIPSDSKLKTIDKDVFLYTKIKSIKIPSELVELKEGWCNFTPRLAKIEVSPENPRYRCIEDKMIIGKTNIDEPNYDCLIFCVRDIIRVQIPNFIENICSFSFDHCNQLEEIEIPNDSKLKTIENFAFVSSTIKSIRIPSKLVELKEGWCNFTPKLTNIKVSPENPRYRCIKDKMIIGKTNIDELNYDCLVFCARDIIHVQIPNFIEHICSFSFEHCNKLEEIEIPNDSKLKTIEKNAFYKSKIKIIKIPSSVTSIGELAFYDCEQLEKIDVPNDSKLQTIDKFAFAFSKIKSIIIPSSVTLIGESAFHACGQLLIVEIYHAKMKTMCQTAFSDCKNLILMIPNQS